MMIEERKRIDEVVIVDVLTVVAIREEILINLLLPLLIGQIIVEEILEVLIIDNQPRLSLVSHAHEVLLECFRIAADKVFRQF